MGSRGRPNIHIMAKRRAHQCLDGAARTSVLTALSSDLTCYSLVLIRRNITPQDGSQSTVSQGTCSLPRGIGYETGLFS